MKKLMKTGILILLTIIVSGVAGYATRIILAQNLSLHDYGLFYAVYGFLFFFAPFRDLGLTQSSVFYINKYEAKKEDEKIKGTIIAGLVPQVVFALIITVVFLLIGNFLAVNYFKDMDSLKVLFVLLPFFLMQTVLVTITHLFLAKGFILLKKTVEMIDSILIALISFILIKNGFRNAISPAYGFLIAFVITLIIAIVYFKIKFNNILKAKTVITKPMIKELFSYAIPITFSTAGSIFLNYSDTILLTAIRGAEAVGLYNIAFPCLNILLLFINPIQNYLFPKISQYYHKKDKKSIEKIINLLYNNLIPMFLPFALLFFAFPDLIISTLFGAKYLSATNTLRVFSLALIFIIIRNINFSVIAGIGKAKERSKILYIGAGSNIVLDLILIPFFGPAGAALATSFGFLLMAFLTTKLIKKDYKVDFPLMATIKTFFSGALFLFLVIILKRIFDLNPLLEAVIVSLIAFLAYFIALYYTKVLTKKKLKIIKDMIISR